MHAQEDIVRPCLDTSLGRANQGLRNRGNNRRCLPLVEPRDEIVQREERFTGSKSESCVKQGFNRIDADLPIRVVHKLEQGDGGLTAGKYGITDFTEVSAETATGNRHIRKIRVTRMEFLYKRFHIRLFVGQLSGITMGGGGRKRICSTGLISRFGRLYRVSALISGRRDRRNRGKAGRWFGWQEGKRDETIGKYTQDNQRCHAQK